MVRLSKSLKAWNGQEFSSTLKTEVEALSGGTLPLERATHQGGYVDDGNISVIVINFRETDRAVHALLGIFFTEIVICCGCGDDPVAVNTYCEINAAIDKLTADTEFNVHDQETTI